MLGLKLQRLGKVGNRPLVVSQRTLGLTSNTESLNMCGIKLQRMGTISNRPFKVSQSTLGLTSSKESPRIFGVKLQRLGTIGNRQTDAPWTVAFNAFAAGSCGRGPPPVQRSRMTRCASHHGTAPYTALIGRWWLTGSSFALAPLSGGLPPRCPPQSRSWEGSAAFLVAQGVSPWR